MPALAFLLVPAAAAGLEVRGRVVDEAGVPLDRARVELRPIESHYDSGRRLAAGAERPEPRLQVVSSADGSYRLEVPEAGMWELEIGAPGHVPLRHRLIPLLQDAELPAASLERDGGVWIQVTDPEGEPVGGAQVWIRPRPGGEISFRERSSPWRPAGRFGRTDDAGNVALSRRRGVPLQVFAWAPGFLPSPAVEVAGERGTVTLVPGSPVRIRFRTADGQPADQALVRIGALQWPSAVTDSRGEVAIDLRVGEPLPFALLLPSGQKESGTLEAEEEDFRKVPDEAEEMVLPRPVRLEGRVIDRAHREPLPGAWVWPEDDAGRGERVDPLGRYRMVAGASSPERLGAAAAGYLPETASPAFGSGSSSQLNFALARAAEIAGRVVDVAGEPVAGATIRTAPEQQGPFSSGERRTTTSLDGAFRVSGLAASRRYELRVEASGFAPKALAVRPSGKSDLEIVLGPGRSLVGRLVTPEGEPVAEARVAAVLSQTAWMRGGPLVSREPIVGRSDGEGRFRLEGLPSDPMVVVAIKSGFAVLEAPALELAEESAGDAPLDLGDLVMEPGSAILGRVHDDEGEPISGVEIRRIGGSGLSLGLGSLLRTELERVPSSSDDQGRFRIEDVAPGEELSLLFDHPDYLRQSANGVRADGEELEIVLEHSARIRGRVVDQSLRPVAGVRVEARAASTSAGSLSGRFSDPTRRDSTVSEEDGSFALSRTPVGRIEVEAEGSGYLSAEVLELALEPGESRSGLELQVRRGVSLEGRVRDDPGRPVAGAIVQVEERRSERYFGSRGGRSPATAESDADGLYRLEGLDPDAVHLILTVHHPEFLPFEQTLDRVVAGGRHDVTLRSGLSVSGRVLTPSGEPVAGAAVALDGGTGAILSGRESTMTAADGSFEIDGVAPGTYLLFAMAEGFARTAADRPLELVDRSLSGQIVYLERGGTIRGRVLGLEPGDRSGVMIMASDGVGQSAAGMLGPDGEYRIPNVGFQEGTVSAIRRRDGKSVSEPFDLDIDGGETWVDLEFRDVEGSRLSGLVLLDGEAWRGVQVMARGGVESQGTATTDASGRFEIRGLLDGRHQLVLLGAGAVSHSEEVEVQGDTQVHVEVTSVRVRGLVVNAETGAPVPRAVVVARSEGALAWLAALGARAETSASGRFELALPAERRVTLQARAEGYAEASLALDTGAGPELEGLVLELEPAGELTVDVRLASGLRPSWVGVVVTDGLGRRIAGEMLQSASGPLRLATVPPGDWTLIVAGEGGATVFRPVTVPGPVVTLVLPPESRIAVDLAPLAADLGMAQLRILGPGGRPLPMPWAGNLIDVWPVLGEQTVVPSVPAGEWTVEVTDDRGLVRRLPVVTVAGQTTRVVVE